MSTSERLSPIQLAPRARGLRAALRCALAVVSAIAALTTTASDAHARGLRDLRPSVEAFEEYVAGYPMLVAITLENTSKRRRVDPIPEWSPFTDRAPFHFILTNAKGKRLTIKSRAVKGANFALDPGESRRMLFDLSLLPRPIPPGRYHFHVALKHRGVRVSSRDVRVRVVAATADERAAAQRLRAAARDGTWAGLVAAASKALPRVALSARTKRVTAFHLFLHRAVYGADGPDRLDLRAAAALAGVLEPDAAVFRLELLKARAHASYDVQAAGVAKRWPALRYRVAEIGRGVGLLSALRDIWGARR